MCGAKCRSHDNFKNILLRELTAMKSIEIYFGCVIFALALLGTSPSVATDPILTGEEFCGHRIANPELIEIALSPRTFEFERFEFLGDRVLGLAVGMFLYKNYPTGGVAELAQIYEQLVSESGLDPLYKNLAIDPQRLASVACVWRLKQFEP